MVICIMTDTAYTSLTAHNTYSTVLSVYLFTSMHIYTQLFSKMTVTSSGKVLLVLLTFPGRFYVLLAAKRLRKTAFY